MFILREFLYNYWTEQMNQDRWRSFPDIKVNIQFDQDDSLLYLEFQEEKAARYYGQQRTWVTKFIETVPKSKFRVLKNKGGFDLAVSEVWNSKAGVDTVELRFSCKLDTTSKRIGNWPNAQWEETCTVNVNLKERVAMYADGKLHHNYKPALVTSNGHGIDKICFYKHGRLCIPPEKKFPARLELLVNGGETLKYRNGKPVPRSLYMALPSLYCRVPKTRWGYLEDLQRIAKQRGRLKEGWYWDDKEIPEELFEFIEYPLDEADMFTVMMAV